VDVKHPQLTPLAAPSSARSPHAEPRPAATPLRCRAHLIPCKEYRAARLRPVNVTVPADFSSLFVIWAVIHGVFSWFYVIYFAMTRQ
jgi:hypothetical protein